MNETNEISRWKKSLLSIGLCLIVAGVARGENPQSAAATSSPASSGAAPKAPEKVDVQPVARDSEIQDRLTRILLATGWFEDPRVEVRDGVVFLSGTTANSDYQKWAEDLARKTQDVAAIVNQIKVRQGTIWDFKPARTEMHSLWDRTIASLPYLVLAAIILLAAGWLSKLATRTAYRLFSRRIQAPLLRTVCSEAIGLLVYLIALYGVLRICGLTRLAVTVIGGTGLLGLVIGIAFRDITENFLASIFLSMQRPFQAGDLVEIAGETGYVQSLTTRTTNIVTVDGNHVQIPNSTVYKSAVRNFSTNPNRRESFSVGIGYQDDVAAAQAVALDAVRRQAAVLKSPEPLVLLDSLASAAVVLQVYFWLDGRDHNWLAVRSAVIRSVKQAFEEQGISIPFEARSSLPPRDCQKNGRRRSPGNDRLTAKAEGELQSEAATIQKQAERSPAPDQGQDLLKSNTNS